MILPVFPVLLLAMDVAFWGGRGRKEAGFSRNGEEKGQKMGDG